VFPHDGAVELLARK